MTFEGDFVFFNVLDVSYVSASYDSLCERTNAVLTKANVKCQSPVIRHQGRYRPNVTQFTSYELKYGTTISPKKHGGRDECFPPHGTPWIPAMWTMENIHRNSLCPVFKDLDTITL